MLEKPLAANQKWTWLKILVIGVIFYVALEKVIRYTDNINYVPSLLLVGSFTAPISFVTFLYSRIKFSVPARYWTTVLICAFYGGLIGTIVAGTLEYDTLRRLGALPTFYIGLIEEGAKLLVPAFFLYHYRDRFVHRYQAIVLGTAAGAGFAVLETMGYGLTSLLASKGDITSVVDTLLLRGVMSPAAHIAWTGITAGALWQLLHKTTAHPRRHFLRVFLTVAILHACWDGFASLPVFVILGIISLTWLLGSIRREKRADKKPVKGTA